MFKHPHEFTEVERDAPMKRGLKQRPDASSEAGAAWLNAMPQ